MPILGRKPADMPVGALARSPRWESFLRLLERRLDSTDGLKVDAILELEWDSLRRMKGCGPRKQEAFDALKTLLRASQERLQAIADAEPIPRLQIRRDHLDQATLKALNKWERALGRELTRADLLQKDFREPFPGTGWGRPSLERLATLADQVEEACVQFLRAGTDAGGASLLREIQEAPLDEQLAHALSQLREAASQERDALMACRSFGISRPAETLEAIGTDFGLTRERVRQLRNQALNRYLHGPIRQGEQALPPEVIGSALEEALPLTRALCFDTEAFLTFLGFLWGRPLPQMRAPAAPNSLPECLADLIRNEPSPLASASILDALRAERAPQLQLQALVDAGFLEPHPDGYLPRRMPVNVAVHYLLLKSPGGLHWREIVRRLDQPGLLDKALGNPRSLSALFNSSPLVYLCGRGCYRHRRYFPLTPRAVVGYTDRIVQCMRAEVENLRDLHHRSGLAEILDYFDLRCAVVQEAARRDDLFFEGQSFTETISRQPVVEHANTYTLVLREVEEADGEIRTVEVCRKLPFLTRHVVELQLSRLHAKGVISRGPVGWVMVGA